MRTIKFRAWNDPTSEMLYSDDFTFSEFFHEIYPLNKNSGLMQFTGLLDKNGKEIYEGDILHSETWGRNSRCLNPYHVVEWRDVGWVASGYNGTMNVHPELTVKQDFEVIGNTYENPELLK
jgi:uncharacterized phage protein (TIGR01671 family)